jgi:pimeloyl-ACP methyl ester carboxylesterase
MNSCIEQEQASLLRAIKEGPLLQNDVERRYFWMPSGQYQLFACLHSPKQGVVGRHGLVLCNPFGHEYIHSHRSLKALADLAAQQGITTLRFDYVGTGDSEGDLLEDANLECFMENIHSAVNFLKQNLGLTDISLLGLRLGATLAAYYAERYSVNRLLLWAPCLNGRAFVREHKAIAKLASFQSVTQEIFTESAGFILSNKLADQLATLTIQFNNLQCQHLVVIKRDDIDDLGDLQTRILNPSFDCHLIRMQGYSAMMAEPQDTDVPMNSIQEIIEHLKINEPSKVNHLRLEQLSNAGDMDSVVEHINIIGEQRLLAIVTMPTHNAPQPQRLPCLILTNSGSVHHVGPNRLYTELARQLAMLGIVVIRFDLRNLGDSSFIGCADDNDAYPASSTDDINQVIQFAKTEYHPEKIIIAGLCSGAHNAFHTVLEINNATDIDEVIMINPLAFYRRPSKYTEDTDNQAFARDISQYRKSIISFEKWKKFLSGKVSFRYIFRFMVKGFSGIMKLVYIRILKFLGIKSVTQLGQDLLRFKSMSIPLTFIIADQDPGKTLLYQYGRDTVKQLVKDKCLTVYDIGSANHTFTTKGSRERLYHCLKTHLLKDEP